MARQESQQLVRVVSSRAANVTKDDLARLIHLFKEPVAQQHWTKFNGANMSRVELDARKSSSSLSEAANPLDMLAEIFNDYDEFTPQHAMLEYTSRDGGKPHRVVPYQSNSEEWENIIEEVHDIEPTNVRRAEYIRDGAWIKQHWLELRKCLHDVFQIYNRSGQQSADKGDWGSEVEIDRWKRNSLKYSKYPKVILYAIGLLEEGIFFGFIFFCVNHEIFNFIYVVFIFCVNHEIFNFKYVFFFTMEFQSRF
jgi:hypothetical protein